jgi:hypothetical protein
LAFDDVDVMKTSHYWRRGGRLSARGNEDVVSSCQLDAAS